MRDNEFLSNPSGAAAVEFAIIAPVLILSVLSIADIGLAVHRLFQIDQTIRNGAEMALRDPGREIVLSVLDEVGMTGDGNVATWSVARRCECPSGSGTVGCGTTACGSQPTNIFYDISGSYTHQGILTPDRKLSRTASVQVR